MQVKKIYLPYTLTVIAVLSINILFAKTEKYRCIWRDTPATTMTIGWNQKSGINPIVYYDIVDHNTNVEAYTFQHKPDRKVWSKGMNNHFARLIDLLPNTAYYFVIQDSEGVSERFWFKTAPDNNYKRLSIIAGGDSRNYWEGRRNANKIVAKLRPHCVVFGGDMTGSDNAKQWIRWMDDWQLTITKDGKMTPIIPARGNHEYSNKSPIDLFDVPSPNVYYALTFGQDLLRVYTLNTLIATNGAQASWLEQDLKDNQHTTWRIAQYHYPIRPHTAKKSERNTQYKAWAKLFYDYQMQLVVECDAHVCKTTWPVRPTYEKGHEEGFIRDDLKGTVYVGEGCWGAPLRPDNDDKTWTRNSGSFNQVKWIFVDNDKMEIRTVKTENPDDLEALTESDIFRMPKNINLWKPSNGSVITINRKGSLAITKSITPPPSPVTVADKNTTDKIEPITPANKKEETKSKETIVAKPVINKPIPEAAVKTKIEQTLNLFDFETVLKEEKVNISWKTLSEPTATYYEVQRSTNGFDFKTIAKIPGVGTTGIENLYRIKDETIDYNKTPFAYYRLQHHFSDGTFQNSFSQRVVLADWSSFEEINIDTVNNAAYIEYNLTQNTAVTIIIFNKKGEILLQRVYLNQIIGEQLKKLTLPNLELGEYLIAIETEGKERWYFKFKK